MEKTKVMIFTNKRKAEECKVEMYGTTLEKVECFRFLGVYFDKTNLEGTYKVHGV